ncbi:hypothetical protein [Rhodanobacter sp. C03]|uniref:hypothetical protein n=1 Tax=Rhodanobacter sp. C03 TaxID=1945858 RepID=UPI0009879C79|nr:hypothetical protein [Rhodanobacter sp. C03]OOG53647.1 hypothetical protein B0E48_15280 [Rhodanobacter sp. C03]
MMARAWRPLLAWLSLLAVALGAAWLRYDLIESSAIGQLCSGNHSPLWCQWRQWLVLGFLHDVYGAVALLAAVMALLSRRVSLAWLAAALGAFALLLYCYEAGALALLIGCLRLLRLQTPTSVPPLEQHRQRDQQIQSEP